MHPAAATFAAVSAPSISYMISEQQGSTGRTCFICLDLRKDLAAAYDFSIASAPCIVDSGDPPVRHFELLLLLDSYSPDMQVHWGLAITHMTKAVIQITPYQLTYMHSPLRFPCQFSILSHVFPLVLSPTSVAEPFLSCW